MLGEGFMKLSKTKPFFFNEHKAQIEGKENQYCPINIKAHLREGL